MKSDIQYKFLTNITKKKAEGGFTLIELLVVVIIIGVLAAVALPNLLGQVAKGRQAEAKNGLGALNRAQQAYRLEKATFGDLSTLEAKVEDPGKYYDFTDIQNGTTNAEIRAVAISTYENDVLDYSGGVYQGTDGTFNSVICEAAALDGGTTTGADAADTGASCDSGAAIE